MGKINRLVAALVFAAALHAQTTPASVMGTVTAFRPDAAELVVKPDAGEEATFKVTTETLFRQVKPGEKDLKNAETIQVTDMAVGDRVLVSKMPDGITARRVIVISAKAITSRNDADRKDWTEHGVAGVVETKKGNDITLRSRSMRMESHPVVIVDPNTKYRRYAAGSVKFADAQPSTLADISDGDQLRARGKKSADGQSVEAAEVVFGTFLTRAGTVLNVDPDGKQIQIKNLEDQKTLTVAITPDSQLKRAPSFGGGAPGMGGNRPAPTPGQATPSSGEHQPAPAQAQAQGGPGAGSGFGGGGFGGGGRPGGPPDLSQMLERMPAAQLAEIKVGDTVIVSSTKGAKPDQLTAIMLLSNADFIVRMASSQAAGQGGAGRGGMQGGQGAGMSMGGGMGGLGLGNLELPGMVP